jgi:hypothetical protein
MSAPTRPEAQPLIPRPENFPSILKRHRIWAVGKLKVDPTGGKTRKIPYDAKTGEPASSTDPASWSTFDKVWERYLRGGYDFVSFFLDPKIIPLTFFDLDDVIDDSGVMSEDAREVFDILNTYVERSINGRGAHALAIGAIPVDGRNGHGREAYKARRQVVITGHRIDGYPGDIQLRITEVMETYARIFPEEPLPPPPPREPSPLGDLNDQALLERMFNSKNGPKIEALFARGDKSAYINPRTCGPDDSAADLGLCDHLAWWTNGDAARVDRLFRDSALMRPKWDEKRGELTYGQRTITKALQGTGPGYTGIPAGGNDHLSERLTPQSICSGDSCGCADLESWKAKALAAAAAVTEMKAERRTIVDLVRNKGIGDRDLRIHLELAFNLPARMSHAEPGQLVRFPGAWIAKNLHIPPKRVNDALEEAAGRGLIVHRLVGEKRETVDKDTGEIVTKGGQAYYRGLPEGVNTAGTYLARVHASFSEWPTERRHGGYRWDGNTCRRCGQKALEAHTYATCRNCGQNFKDGVMIGGAQPPLTHSGQIPEPAEVGQPSSGETKEGQDDPILVEVHSFLPSTPTVDKVLVSGQDDPLTQAIGAAAPASRDGGSRHDADPFAGAPLWAGTPSCDWQSIPDGTPIPPGAEVSMSFVTGENRARWPGAPSLAKPAVGPMNPGERAEDGPDLRWEGVLVAMRERNAVEVRS